MTQVDVCETLSAEMVLKKYADMVYRLAYARTMNTYDAEDVTQEVFLKYIKHQDELCTEEHRRAWLIKVTVNTSKSLLTSSWNKKKTSLESEEEVCDESNPFDEVENYGIMQEVGRLPEKYRVVIHLFYFEELSISEIADSMKSKESTVKSLLFRARKMLGERLDKEDYDV